MAGFDAETYLRLTAEQRLREGGSIGAARINTVLVAAAAALVAVDAINTADAQAIIDDYDQAVTLRTGRHLINGQAPRPPTAAAPGIGQVRVVPCGRVIGQEWGQLTILYVAFTDHATTLRVELRLDVPSERFSPGRPIPAQARRLSVTDSRTTTATAEFSGGGRIGGSIWHGQYEVRPLLAVDTTWIELLGERVELTAKPAHIKTWAEPLPAQDRAVQHLWERVATLNDFHDPHLALEATITALAAAGALPAHDPQIGAARAALTVLRPDGAVPAGDPGDVPEPWPSLLARWGQTGGPSGTIAVGSITPSFDGITAAIIELESRDEHFGIKVELVPSVRTGLPYRDLPDQQHLTWWAADNLDNRYLGEQGSWDPRGGRGQGSIGFWPALDTRASSIDLMPTATTARAVIRVPLPWAEHQ